jgi:hypothetical protein
MFNEVATVPAIIYQEAYVLLSFVFNDVNSLGETVYILRVSNVTITIPAHNARLAKETILYRYLHVDSTECSFKAIER